MIQLHSDCLVFKTSSGQFIPCSAEMVTVELIGEAASSLDSELIRQAAAAVLFYFKNEQGRVSVSVGEFSLALEQVLRGFGLVINSSENASPAPRTAEADMRQLACESGKGFELAFFDLLRKELRHQLKASPQLLRFKGLRSCVKQLAGAQRWCKRCQKLSDHIVDYLRLCLSAERSSLGCALLVV